MSLEQALNEATSAINKLVAVLTKADMGIPISEQNQSVTTEQTTKKEPEHPLETKPTWTTSDVKVPPLEEVIKSLLALSKKDRDSAVALLTSFRAKNAREVPEEARAEFLQAVNKRLLKLQGE